MGIFAGPSIPLAWPLIKAGVAVVGAAVILATSNGSNNSSGSGNGTSNGNGSSRTSDTTTSNTNNGGTSQSKKRETEDAGTGGGGNGGRGNGNGDRKKTDHEMDNQEEDKENTNENQTEQERTSRCRVCTAWLEPVDYPQLPQAQTSVHTELKLKLVYGGRAIETICYPRLHLIYRCRMFFYGIGRLQKLCKELGLKMNDICKFGTSVYRDARQGKLVNLPEFHAAHVFPVTDFNFELIRERIRQRNWNRTQDQINQLIRDIENILRNMVGQTDYVHRAYNASGTVGRALDNFLRDFIQENRIVNSGNIGQVVNSLIQRMRSSIRPESQHEIEEAIRIIQPANASEWLRRYDDGLNGEHDNHFNQTRRTIDENIKRRSKDNKKN